MTEEKLVEKEIKSVKEAGDYSQNKAKKEDLLLAEWRGTAYLKLHSNKNEGNAGYGGTRL